MEDLGRAVWSLCLVLLAVSVAGCGRLGFELVEEERDGGGPATCELGPFGPPERVFGTPAPDYGPTISADGLTLYLAHDGPGGQGGSDLWMATRADLASPFGSPVNLHTLNSDGFDGEPALSADGLALYFESDRGGQVEIWRSTRPDSDEEFAAPVRIAATALAEISNARGPSITADGLELYFGSDQGRTTSLWRLTRSSLQEPFGSAAELVELSDNPIWGYPGISPDGLELFFVNSEPHLQIMVARRPDRASPFSVAAVVTELDAVAGNSDPDLSPDGRTIVFTSNRLEDDYDVWLATRGCLP